MIDSNEGTGPEAVPSDDSEGVSQSQSSDANHDTLETPVGTERSEKPSIRKSTGPRTATGKDRSKRNSVRHGIFSSIPLLSGESAAAYRKLLKEFRDYHQPHGTPERVCVDGIAYDYWCLRRLCQAEFGEISENMELARITAITESSQLKRKLMKKLSGDEWKGERQVRIEVVRSDNQPKAEISKQRDHAPENTKRDDPIGLSTTHPNRISSSQSVNRNPKTNDGVSGGQPPRWSQA